MMLSSRSLEKHTPLANTIQHVVNQRIWCIQCDRDNDSRRRRSGFDVTVYCSVHLLGTCMCRGTVSSTTRYPSYVLLLLRDQ
mmetsp:Transcript_6259/g.9451  ORF Transcript_6259/g.9451 Transcript_6259/m.9451 type:complete len:82 (+) Transcript_6259:2869-3114(+)